MLTLLAAFALASQLEPAPIKQPGTNDLFFRTTLAVEEALQKGDFAGAARAAKALPKRQVTLEWDATSIPATQRVEFAQARDAVLKELNERIPDVAIKVAPKGEIRITFQPTIPGENGQPGKGAVLFTSPDPAETRVEAVVALRRGQPAILTEFNDVYAEVGFAVLTYFGLAESPLPGLLTHRRETVRMDRPRLQGSEVLLARNNLRIVDSLMVSIQTKKRLQSSTPRIRVDVKEIRLPDAVQGDQVPLSYQITNLGDGPLRVFAAVDCGCLSGERTAFVDPGGTVLMRGNVDTTEFVGRLEKKFFLATNDPQVPSLELPVRVDVKPLYRFVTSGGDHHVPDESGQTHVQVVLWAAAGVDLKPGTPKLDGLPGSVQAQPFSGEMADPEMNEGPMARTGHAFKVTVGPPPAAGRYPVTLRVPTQHPLFPELRKTIFIQTGIIAIPGSVYLGEIPKAPRRASFIVSRPSKAFAVTKVTVDTPFATGSSVSLKGGTEHRITVQFNGNQDFGTLNMMVQVHTDDPKQPTVSVPIQAVVK